MTDLLAIAEEGVKRALGRGAESAEVYAVRSRSLYVGAAGRYAIPTLREDQGLAVRVARGGRVGGAGVASHGGLDSAIRDALAAAARPGAPPAVPLLAPEPPRHREGFDRAIHDPDGERVVDVAEEFIREGLRRPGVTYAQVALREWSRQVAVANSAGRAILDEAGGHVFDGEVRVTRGSGDRTSREALAIPARSVDVSGTLDRIVEHARSALDHEPLRGNAVYEVILHPPAVAQLLTLLSASFSGIAIASGKSPLARPAGAPFAPAFSLVDDPAGLRVYDDEGTPTQKRSLVEAGRVVGHLHDARSAHGLGTVPTGNGYRGGVQSGVMPRPTRLALVPGEASVEELVETAERAILVTDPMLGSFASDKVTADFSVVAPFAFYVEGGRIRHPLPPITIGGNAHAVFASLRLAGRDRRPCVGADAPAVRAGGVTCAT